MLASLTATPAATIVISRYTIHAFVDRYVLWSVIGMAALCAFALHRELREHQLAAAILITGLIAAVLAHQIKAISTGGSHLRDAQAAFSRILEIENDADPILIPNSHTFLELSYYAPAAMRSRIYYPIQKDVLFHRDAAVALEALANRTDLHIVNLDHFAHDHKSGFFVISSDSMVLAHLMQCGLRLRPEGRMSIPQSWRATIRN